MKRAILLTVLLWIGMIHTVAAQPQKKPVSELLYQTIESEGVESAVARYKELKKMESTQYDLSEGQLNALGYKLMNEKRKRAAIAIFKVNAEMHPQSINVWDSLAEGYLTIGEYEMAAQKYQEVLKMLEDGTALSPQRIAFYRVNALTRLGESYLATGKNEMAAPKYKQTLKILEEDTTSIPRKKFFKGMAQNRLYEAENFDPVSDETIHFVSFFGGGNAGKWDMQNAVEFKQRSGTKISYDGTNLYFSPVPGNVEEMLTGENPADVTTSFVAGDYRRFIEKGLIADLSHLWKEQGWEEVFPNSFKRMASYKGKQYFVPMAFQWNPIFYRKDIFNKHDLSPPQSWQELLDLCDRLNELGYAPFSIAVQNWPPPVNRWFTILNLRLNGPEFHEKVMRGKVSFTDDRIRNIFVHWRELFRHDAFVDSSFQNNYQKGVQDFVSGKAAMYNLGEWLYESAPVRKIETKLDFFPFPKINPDVPSAEIVHTYGAFMRAENAHPEKSEELLQWLASTESQQSNVETNRRIVANTSVDQSLYTDMQKRIIPNMKETEVLVPLFEMNTHPEFAWKAMAIFQEYWQHPEDMDATLKKLEKARMDIFGKANSENMK